MKDRYSDQVRPLWVSGYFFSLFNAPATFQGYVNKILFEKFDIFIIVYQDDILIYTKDPGQPHVEAVR